MAMAGGYATYGDWSGGVSHYYMGEPGPGKGALQLKHLRQFFEELPFNELEPAPALTTAGFCLARPPDCYVFYLFNAKETEIDLSAAKASPIARWFDPRTGQWQNGPSVSPRRITLSPPTPDDWVLCIK
jgi:hypothetical protein